MQQHRVTELFAGAGTGTLSLRQGMGAFALGAPMSAQLASEITAYQLCMIDDTWAESIHRDVSTQKVRAYAASLPHRAATLRFKDNLRQIGCLSETELATFVQCVRRWRSVMSPRYRGTRLDARRLGRLVTGRKVCEHVCRHGVFMQTNGARERLSTMGAISFTEDEPIRQLRAMEKLEKAT